MCDSMRMHRRPRADDILGIILWTAEKAFIASDLVEVVVDITRGSFVKFVLGTRGSAPSAEPPICTAFRYVMVQWESEIVCYALQFVPVTLGAAVAWRVATCAWRRFHILPLAHGMRGGKYLKFEPRSPLKHIRAWLKQFVRRPHAKAGGSYE